MYDFLTITWEYILLNIMLNIKFNCLDLLEHATIWVMCGHAMAAHVLKCPWSCVSVRVFSSVTAPHHSCPRQLRRHITMPGRSVPKLNSQIPRFPQLGFPNHSRISVSCSGMTDGYPWESSVWVFCFLPKTTSCFKSWCLWQKTLLTLHASFIENMNTGQLGLGICPGWTQNLRSINSPAFHRHRISLPQPYAYHLQGVKG